MTTCPRVDPLAGTGSRHGTSSFSAAAVLTAALIVGGCGCVAPPCACAGDASAPPVAVGASAGVAEPKNLDEWLGYVAGEQLTRRMIVRQIGARSEGQSELEYERR